MQFDGKYNNIKNAIAQQKIILNAEQAIPRFKCVEH